MDRIELETKLVNAYSEIPNGLEFLVGALSSLCSEEQLTTLLDNLSKADQD